MRVTPQSETEIVIVPETEIESFFINKFMQEWATGFATITVKSGLHGMNPQTVLEFKSKSPVLMPSPIKIKK